MNACGCGCKSGARCCVQSPATPEPPAWLDKPDCDGWWWRVWLGSNPSRNAVRYRLAKDEWEFCGHWTHRQPGPYERWQRIPEPTPPPPPLPKSREVTAKVRRATGGSFWIWTTFMDGMKCHTSARLFDTAENAARACRDTYGIEPEVES